MCLQEYVEAILALQAKHKKGTQIPLAIMTSLDTHSQTESFLKDNRFFGAKPSQIHLIKQEKVGGPTYPAQLRDLDLLPKLHLAAKPIACMYPLPLTVDSSFAFVRSNCCS